MVAKKGTGGAKRAPRSDSKSVAKTQHSPTPKKAKADRRLRTFIDRYLVHLNGTKAAVEAGYSPASARFTASELLAKPEVQSAIAAAMQERSERTKITQDKVLERLWAVATADPGELIQNRRICCRYCWGKKNRYQRTPRELADAVAQFERDKLATEAKGQPFAASFDPQGGTGYDPRKDPNPECPECFGQGEQTVFALDTRDLSPAAKLLYAGVKQTEKGFEVKMHNQTEALLNVGKHLGMFTKHVKHSNDPDNPMPTSGLVLIPAKALPEDAG